jgi:hypothetical protein
MVATSYGSIQATEKAIKPYDKKEDASNPGGPNNESEVLLTLRRRLFPLTEPISTG